MNGTVTAAVLAALVVALGAALVPGCGRRRDGRPDSPLLNASRGVTPLWNASAIGGEYLSAAAYLGLAGLLLAYGADILWLPVGATAGYVLLVALVAAPLRRSGAYTVSDFAEWRLGSRVLRRLSSACVCLIGWCCLLPQFRGAGITLRVLTGAPMWTGWAVVVVAVLVLVLTGCVRSMTNLQAVQYWVKLVALTVPALALIMIWRLDGGGPDGAAGVSGDGPPRFARVTTVHAQTDLVLRMPDRLEATVRGRLDGTWHGGERVTITAGRHTVEQRTRMTFPAGAAVPHLDPLPVQDEVTWATPLSSDRHHRLYATYALTVCAALGTVGLPHVLMRFYTNACGAAARRTAATVPVLLALFYLFPAVYGALGRLYAPELLMTGDTDAVVLTLPRLVLPGTGGALLTGLVVAGAFAAFASASCGVVVATASTLAQCLARGRIAGFRLGALIVLAVPLSLMPGPLGGLGAGRLIALGLTVSACSLCPLLVLGLWWRGLTAAGAGAGLVTGAGLALAAGVTGILAGQLGGWPEVLLAQPAPVIVPVTFAVMAGVSLLTRPRVPRDADRALARLHLPEGAADRTGSRGPFP
ncbi:cation acetate symporter [Actinomadura viridis]|uniref:sodium:solute symporter family transporter n=1 Tax=Actinomadura viridis TaxID=58110 RepID=UPI0036A312F7